MNKEEPETTGGIIISPNTTGLMSYTIKDIIIEQLSARTCYAFECDAYILRKPEIDHQNLPYHVLEEKADLPNKQTYGFYRKFEKRKR